MSKIKEEFEKVVFKLLNDNPFYANLLMMVRRQFVRCDNEICALQKWQHCKHCSVPTAMVVFQSPPLLVINENFFQSLDTGDKSSTLKLRMGVLEHEVLHMVMKHDGIRFEDEDYKSDSKLLNMAMDLVVNQLIHKDKLLPTYYTIDKWKFEPNKTTHYYYEELKKIRDKNLEKFKKLLEGGGGEGYCCKSGEDPSGSSDWNTEVDLTLKSMIKDAWEKAQNSKEGIGSLPGGLVEYINNLLSKPKVPWNKELRSFPGNLGRAKLYHTNKRESKRYNTIPGVKIRGNCKLLVAIDTSGSISGEQLSIFNNELIHMHKNGAEVTVAEVDTQVHRHYPFSKKLKEVHGRGGTNLMAVFNWIKNHKLHYEGIIFLTDGDTPFLPEAPISAKVLWVIHKNPNCPLGKIKWGKVIHIS